MPALERDQTSDCSNPVLDIFTTIQAQPVDIAELEFQIFEKVTDPQVPVQTFPPSGRQAVDVVQDCPTGERISTGRYVATFTVPTLELLGTHLIKWFFKLTASSVEQQFTEEFEVVPVVVGVSPGTYCTIQDMRDEGVPASFSDSFLQKRISTASSFIDEYTGRFFTPVSKVIRLDGKDSQGIILNEPIIRIDKLEIEFISGTGEFEELDLDQDTGDVRIYNRHLSQNLTDPDDRDNPLIEAFRTTLDHVRITPRLLFRLFPAGAQNIRITGVFGYTDFDGTSLGVTPPLICDACKLLTIGSLPLKIETTGPQPIGTIWKEETRDQRVEYGAPEKMAIQGAFTGDPRIDNILARYRRPPKMAVV